SHSHRFRRNFESLSHKPTNENSPSLPSYQTSDEPQGKCQSSQTNIASDQIVSLCHPCSVNNRPNSKGYQCKKRQDIPRCEIEFAERYKHERCQKHTEKKQKHSSNLRASINLSQSRCQKAK